MSDIKMDLDFYGNRILAVCFFLMFCALVKSENCIIDIQDELWPMQWYLKKGVDDKYDMNVLPSWESCINGTGVTVGVVDKGVQDHFDLNIDRSISFKTAGEDSLENLQHGTRAAGVIGALKNGQLTVGIAFGSVIADIDLSSTNVWETLDTRAMTHKMNDIDIYSCSFANFHTGTKTYPLLDDQEAAFRNGTTLGRNGRGNVYVFATGNTGGTEDDLFRDSCAYDRLVTNRFVISVAGVQHDLSRVPNGEACSAMLVAAFTARAGATDHKVYTTDIRNNYTEHFNQNSAAAPMVSGAVALALSVRYLQGQYIQFEVSEAPSKGSIKGYVCVPDLTYRDVMHLLVLTSRSNLSELQQSDNFITNAANLSVSSYFGFGLLDIGSLVARSRSWQNVPSLKSCTANNKYTYPVASGYLIVHVDSCQVTYTEHVEVTLRVNHPQAGQIRWVLISPYGTRSIILPGRGLDPTKSMDLTVLTVQMWGENPNGYWRLEAIPVFGAKLDDGMVPLFKLTAYGFSSQDSLDPAVQDSSQFVTPKPNVTDDTEVQDEFLIVKVIVPVIVLVLVVSGIIVFVVWYKKRDSKRQWSEVNLEGDHGMPLKT